MDNADDSPRDVACARCGKEMDKASFDDVHDVILFVDRLHSHYYVCTGCLLTVKGRIWQAMDCLFRREGQSTITIPPGKQKARTEK